MKDDPAAAKLFPGLAAVRGLMLGLFVFAAWPAAAIPKYILPTLFDVTGVAENDVLNIREAPDADAAIIRTLAPETRDNEVVGYDQTGRWARINTGERSGWAALRYLAYQVDGVPHGHWKTTTFVAGGFSPWSFIGRSVLGIATA